MDGFRERLGGRYDRSMARGAGYDRMSSDERYDGDRYERGPRRGAPEGISQEAVSEAVNEAITKSNREQLDVIADFFDEAKADRMESERAIIDALSHGLDEAAAAGAKQSRVSRKRSRNSRVKRKSRPKHSAAGGILWRAVGCEARKNRLHPGKNPLRVLLGQKCAEFFLLFDAVFSKGD